VAVFARRGLKVGVTTNGSLLTPELIDRLVAAGLKRLIVSVDHHLAAEHDDLRGQAGLLANVERAVRYAASRHAAAGLSVEANTVAHRRNFRALAELSATLHAWGARTHNVHPIMDYYPLKISAQSREASADLFFQPADLPALRGEVDRYFAALRALGMAATTTAELWRRAFEFYAGRHQRYICAIAGVSVDVLADGEVEFCCGAEITFGNIRRQSLRELWRSPEAQRQHQQLRHCVRCVDSCQADLRLRFSPAYLLRRLPDVLREAWRLT
jgi:MoaA/NifB/PqqE/SkfB family radical SAM enzyme